MNNSEDLSLTDKSVDLQAQCDKKRSESSSTDKLMIINIFRKRWENRIMRKLSQCLKKIWHLSSDDIFNAENLYFVWYHNNISLLTCVQQTHHCECVIWENLSHTLLDITHCDSCRRVRVDKCFVMQINSVCTHCTSLHNSHDQCSAELSITTALFSERSDVVVLCTHVYNDKRDSSTL